MRYELTDRLRSYVPNKRRGIPRVDDRRVYPTFIKLASTRIWLRTNKSAPELNLRDPVATSI